MEIFQLIRTSYAAQRHLLLGLDISESGLYGEVIEPKVDGGMFSALAFYCRSSSKQNKI